jgi:hypothetical protein
MNTPTTTPRSAGTGTTEGKSQESEDILRQRRSPPKQTPKKVLFQTPETGGGKAAETGGAAEQTPGRIMSLSRAISAIGNTTRSEFLDTVEKAMKNKNMKLLTSLQGIGPATASVLLSDDPDEKRMIMRAIEDRRKTISPPRPPTESGGAAPNRYHLFDEILTRKLRHHTTGEPYTLEQLKSLNTRSLLSIVSRSNN